MYCHLIPEAKDKDKARRAADRAFGDAAVDGSAVPGNVPGRWLRWMSFSSSARGQIRRRSRARTNHGRSATSGGVLNRAPGQGERLPSFLVAVWHFCESVVPVLYLSILEAGRPIPGARTSDPLTPTVLPWLYTVGGGSRPVCRRAVRMSDIGTIIAIVSTLISSIALVGVMVGLMMQARQLQLGRVQAFLSTQAELLRMTLEYPDSSVTYRAATTDPATIRIYVTLNWRLRHFLFGYAIGQMSESAIRDQVTFMFSTPEGREWWSFSRSYWECGSATRKERKYLAIVNEVYAICVTQANS